MKAAVSNSFENSPGEVIVHAKASALRTNISLSASILRSPGVEILGSGFGSVSYVEAHWDRNVGSGKRIVFTF